MRMEGEIGESRSVWGRQGQLVQAVMDVDEELWLAVMAELSGDRELARTYLREARAKMDLLKLKMIRGVV